MASDRKIRVRIVGPEEIFFDKSLDIFTIKTIAGFIGFKRDHVPFVSMVRPCVINLPVDDKTKRKAAIGEGMIYNDSEEVKIITNDIIWLDEINIDSEQKKAKELRESLDKMEQDNDNFNQIDVQLKKIMNRIDLAKGA